jgi:hypothetical protein
VIKKEEISKYIFDPHNPTQCKRDKKKLLDSNKKKHTEDSKYSYILAYDTNENNNCQLIEYINKLDTKIIWSQFGIFHNIDEKPYNTSCNLKFD